MEHRKWLKRKLRDNQPRIRLEGNKGGNFVELIPMKNDRVYLHSGCGCVVTIDAVVPNEFLSILLRDCILDYGSVKEYLEAANYDEDYRSELIKRGGDRTDERSRLWK